MEKRIFNEESVFEQIREKIESVEYGSVTVIIQDKRVVQIETTEKKRIRTDR